MRELNNTSKTCPQCGGQIIGRSDRRFCASQCKNAWHYAKTKEKDRIFDTVDRVLHKNRDILKRFYQYSQETRYVPMNRFLSRGFDLNYYHRIIMNQNGTGNNLYVIYDFSYVHDHAKGVKIFYRWMFPSLK